MVKDHKPGPWAVRNLDNFGYNVVHYRNGDKFDIQRVAKCATQEDATIVSLAPEMLSALKYIVRNWPEISAAKTARPIVRKAGL